MNIICHIDHTLLKQTATWQQIQQLCKEAIQQKTASVCIPPSYVKKASEFVNGQIAICTVIGFPNGYHTTEVKVFETENAIKNGANEIDMVINLGWVNDGLFDLVEQEIKAVKKACRNHILKVIVETCYLTNEQKQILCKIVSHSGADYIKTSTGFGNGGATVEDIKLFSENISNNVKIKAAGGIKSVSDAEEFLNMGVERLGSSSLLSMITQK
ncbi:deoxyribose-phosphate aldolase [Clostridium sp. MD294]|uniref:deoxyribose-phosphate aldolase n=1 Tax=Clostridium sp. MD294 TaxID=97138 RepID=UPI0002C9CE80|nr:deoxyribose-phosphate aldolase [Clostridium sp. MD294]NDO46168.1 deoxyribose-phosphate aldolase [Clostridium sp. MD294]USF30166.1 Deoxyribose-phosphate aldolase [Clostridium sp. MD294]